MAVHRAEVRKLPRHASGWAVVLVHHLLVGELVPSILAVAVASAASAVGVVAAAAAVRRK